MLSDFRLGIKFANIIAIGTLYLHDLFPLAPFDYHPHRNKTKCAYRGLGPNAACPARNRSRAILLSDDSIRSLQGRYDFSEPCNHATFDFIYGVSLDTIRGRNLRRRHAVNGKSQKYLL